MRVPCWMVCDDYGGQCGRGIPHSRGAGMYNYGSSPKLANCVLRDNRANHCVNHSGGGAMFNELSNPTLNDCVISVIRQIV